MNHMKPSQGVVRRVSALLLVSLLMMSALVSCKKKEEKPKSYATIQMEDDLGEIVIELDPNAAPITVENFKKLAGEGFYDGLTFHRIMKGFMIQGGDPLGTGTGGSGTSIKGEFKENGVDNPLKHVRGTVSMARSEAPDSASSQFFICVNDAGVKHLDGKYAAFGTVLKGMEVADKIVELHLLDPTSVPAMKSITISEENPVK